MRDLHKVDSRVQLVILHDGSHTTFDHLKYFQVDMVRVPYEFQPQKAKHKARALEFFRRHVNFGEDDWILHLDEETMVDDHCVAACIDFIERDVKHDYAQVRLYMLTFICNFPRGSFKPELKVSLFLSRDFQAMNCLQY